MPCACSPERRRARVGGCSGGVHVVHEAHSARRRTGRDDGVADVPAAVHEREPALGRERARAAEELAGGQFPLLTERACESSRGDVSTLPGPLRIARHVDESVDRRRGNDHGDEPSCLLGEPSPSVLFPLAYEPPRALVVHDRGARPCEREPTARALGAAADGPRTRRPAAFAERLAQPHELVSAVDAEHGSRARAHGAALGEEKLEHVEHVSIVGGYVLRLCEKIVSASRSVSAEPMSYHSPGSGHV